MQFHWRNWKEKFWKEDLSTEHETFLIADQCQKGNLKIACCPTDKMIADFIMKGLSGKKFAKFCKEVMGMD